MPARMETSVEPCSLQSPHDLAIRDGQAIEELQRDRVFSPLLGGLSALTLDACQPHIAS